MSEALNTLTTEEAAQALGVTSSRVRQMIRSGQLPAKRFGKAHLILERDLESVRERPVGRPPNVPATKAAKTKSGRTTPTPSPPGVATLKEVRLKSEAKKGGKK